MKYIILIILVLFLVSCVPGPSQRIAFQNVRVGTQGLDVQFISSSPPSKVKPNSYVPIYLDVRNQGAADIERGYYRVQGLDPSVLTISPIFGTYRLTGKSISDPIGERALIQLEGETGSLIGTQKSLPALFDIQFCYPYSTSASIEVCIDTDILGERQEQKVCTPRTHVLAGGQGAPVGVVHVKTEKPRFVKGFTDVVVPRFLIKLQNLGKGTIVPLQDVADHCSGLPSFTSEKKVNVQVLLSDQPTTCTLGEGTITKKIEDEVEIKEKVIELYCELTEGLSTRRGTYLGLLQIKLDYGYIQKVSKSFHIVK